MTKDQLVLSMESYFLPMASAYRKGYSTQCVITGLVEGWKEHIVENFVAGAVLTDLFKAFDSIAHNLLIANLWHMVLATQHCVMFIRT